MPLPKITGQGRPFLNYFKMHLKKQKRPEKLKILGFTSK